ncbi:MAG: hypothetical protein Q8M58_09455, partial [Anaerolineales bacterium]|nr:hypothetical protein [Anaerolineales bacterium]
SNSSGASGKNHPKPVRWCMKDWTAIRERYMRDELPIRLGGLAANLGRIKSFSENESNRSVVESLIEESKYFIEWTAPEAEIETAAQLVELQLELVRWQYKMPQIWSDPNHRKQIAEKSNVWSKQVLTSSGLI